MGRLSNIELEALRDRYPQPIPLSDEPGRHERHMRQILTDMNRIFDHIDTLEHDPDAALLEILQTMRMTIDKPDGLGGRLKWARVSALVNEALRTMGVVTW